MNVIFAPTAEKTFLKFDNSIQLQIKKFIEKLKTLTDPRATGKALVGNLAGFWRYRVGDYRLLCKIQDKELVIVVVEIGHRREIYKK